MGVETNNMMLSQCVDGSINVRHMCRRQRRTPSRHQRPTQTQPQTQTRPRACATLLSILTILLLVFLILCTCTTHHAAATVTSTVSSEQHQPHHSLQLHLADDWLLQYDSGRRVTRPHSHSSATAAYTYSHSHSRSSSTVAATLKWKETDIIPTTSQSQTDSQSHGASSHRHGDTESDTSNSAAASSDSSHTHTHTHSFSSNHRPVHRSHSHTHAHRPLLHYTLLAEWPESDNDENADNITVINADGSRNMKRDRSWSRKKHEPTSNTSSSHSHSNRTSSQHQDDSVATTQPESSHHPHHHQQWQHRHRQHRQHHRRLLCSGASLTSCTAIDLPIHTPITLQLIVNDVSNECDCPCHCESDDECKTRQNRDHTNSRNDDTSCSPSSRHHPPFSSILSSPITIMLQPRDGTHDDVGGKSMRDVNGNTHHDPTPSLHALAQSDAAAGILTRHTTRATSIPITTSSTDAPSSTDATSTSSPHRYHPHVDDEVQMMEVKSRHSSRESLHSQPSHSNDLNQDDELIGALCRFFNETNGEQWSINVGWKEACIDGKTLNVCSWLGIECDESQRVIRLSLVSNGLTSQQSDGSVRPFSIQLFDHLTSLESMDLSWNTELVFPRPFNLTMLGKLRSLTLEQLTLDPMDPTPSVITLLPPPYITNLQLTHSAVDVDLRFLPSLEWLYAGLLPIDVETLSMMPKLGYLQLENTGMTCSRTWSTTGNSVTTRSSGSVRVRSSSDHDQSNDETTCDERILGILSNLTQTNPDLKVLTMINVHLDAIDTGRSLPAFPIIHSASLEELSMSGSWLPASVPDEWLSGMPVLTKVTLQQSAYALQRMSMNANAFALASSTRFALICIMDVNLYGDATPLTRFHSLSSLVISRCGWRTALPMNVSSYWPSIIQIDLSSNALYGRLPSFAGLSALVKLSLSRNGWEGEVLKDFLDGCNSLMDLDLSNKYE